jgi:transcriptional regulator with XRE-family HTH domain
MSIASRCHQRSYVGMKSTPETIAFGKALAATMERARMTQEKLAELAGVSQSTVSKMLRGEQRAYADQAVAFARALGCSVDEVCGHRGPLSADEWMLVDAIRASGREPIKVIGDLISLSRSPVPTARDAVGMTVDPPRSDDGQGQGGGRRSG